VYGGVTVVWRDRRFKVGFDAKVREIGPSTPPPVEDSIHPKITLEDPAGPGMLL
jgi:hypothetical protein